MERELLVSLLQNDVLQLVLKQLLSITAITAAPVPSVVASNLLGKPRDIEIPAIPSVVFTIPQCATIGLTEKEANEKKLDFKIIQQDASNWFNTKRINADAYRWKIILDKKTDLILGAHIASHEAGEQVNMIAIAMNAGMTFTNFKRTIFTYPSWGNDFKSYE